MLGQASKTTTKATCDPPLSGCLTTINKAPMCTLQEPKANGKVALYGGGYDRISTWSPTGWPTTNNTETECTSGQFTNCYAGMWGG